MSFDNVEKKGPLGDRWDAILVLIWVAVVKALIVRKRSTRFASNTYFISINKRYYAMKEWLCLSHHAHHKFVPDRDGTSDTLNNNAESTQAAEAS